jgi:hypothetical protein
MSKKEYLHVEEIGTEKDVKMTMTDAKHWWDMNSLIKLNKVKVKLESHTTSILNCEERNT